MQICRKNSKSIKTQLSSFFQRSFLYFHLCLFFARMIKGTSYKIFWKNKKDNFKKKHEIEKKNYSFSSTHHHYKVHEHGSLYNIVTIVIHCCSSSSQSRSIAIIVIVIVIIHHSHHLSPSLSVVHCSFVNVIICHHLSQFHSTSINFHLTFVQFV